MNASQIKYLKEIWTHGILGAERIQLELAGMQCSAYRHHRGKGHRRVWKDVGMIGVRNVEVMLREWGGAGGDGCMYRG